MSGSGAFGSCLRFARGGLCHRIDPIDPTHARHLEQGKYLHLQVRSVKHFLSQRPCSIELIIPLVMTPE